MTFASPRLWWPKTATLLIWLAVGLCVAYWALRTPAPSGALSGVAPARVSALEPNAAWAGLALGAKAPASSASGSVVQGASDTGANARFQLLGLIADGLGGGAALLAVDGQAAKPFRKGALVKDQWALARIDRQSVWLGAPREGQLPEASLEIKLVKPSERPVTPGTGSAMMALPPGLSSATPSTIGSGSNTPPPLLAPNMGQREDASGVAAAAQREAAPVLQNGGADGMPQPGLGSAAAGLAASFAERQRPAAGAKSPVVPAPAPSN